MRKQLVAATFLAALVAPVQALAVEQQQLDAFTRDALQRAYEDTHASHAFYSAVVARHGKIAPFVGVLEGEARQEKALQALAKANEVSVSAAAGPKQPEVPATVKDACSAAVDLEKHSVALYDEVTANVKNSAIRDNFEHYRETAAAHQLPAFERCVARGGATPAVEGTGAPAGSKGDGASPPPSGDTAPGPNSGAATDPGTGNASATASGTATANMAGRCDSCGMAGCGCDQGVKAEEGAPAGTAPGPKAAQHTCGCMRGKTNP